MPKKADIADLPDFDIAKHLSDDQAIAQYLNLVLEENDPGELTHALGVIARARGMSQIARDSGISIEALYHALQAGTQPRFDTVSKVCRALGVKLVAHTIS